MRPPRTFHFGVPPVGCGLMLGKRLVKGFLVDSNGGLVKEFVFTTKSDVTYEQLRPLLQGRGDVGALGAFEVGKLMATVVRGDKLHFIAVGKGIAEAEDVGFVRELLTSSERSFDQSIRNRLKTATEAEEQAKLVQTNAAQAMEVANQQRQDLAQEAGELDELRQELDRLRSETGQWQDELKEFESQVTQRHNQINDRVALLLEREQAFIRNKQAFEVASEAKRALIRKLQEAAAESIAGSEAGLVKFGEAQSELANREEAFRAESQRFAEDKTRWEAEAEEVRKRIQTLDKDHEELLQQRAELEAKEKGILEQGAALQSSKEDIENARAGLEAERQAISSEILNLFAKQRG